MDRLTNMPTSPDDATAQHLPAKSPYPVLSNRTIFWSAATLILLAAGLAIALLAAFGDGKHTDQLDAIKTAGTIVIGTGGAAALWLTARRQRTNEIALNQKQVDQEAIDRAFALQKELSEQDLKHQERVAVATEHDATERRLNDLYLKAVEQLGSTKAAVRHGGLYALERVAQDNPAQRQTVVDVICAYLRAPFTPPDTLPEEYENSLRIEIQQEKEVRSTAQQILARHLGGLDRRNHNEGHWQRLNVNLSGATLIDFNFSLFDIMEGTFRNTRFYGPADFSLATFSGNADFSDSKFFGVASFSRTVFDGYANFLRIELDKAASFEDCRLSGDANFSEARFLSSVSFSDSTFERSAAFRRSEFAAASNFEKASFARGAEFQRVTFSGNVTFQKTTFSREAQFFMATFTGIPEFEDTVFNWPPKFREARFANGVPAALSRYITQ
jgi:hypothetical protein